MFLYTYACGIIGVNSYIFGADDSKTCCVVDPGDAKLLQHELERLSLQCTHILLTHAHFDHIWGLSALKKQTGALVCVHEDDAPMLVNARLNMSVMVGRPVNDTPADVILHDNGVLEAAGLSIRVLHTPGHSPGGVCYVIDSEKIAFVGDTIFLESVGRTDFPGCSQHALYTSIRDCIFTLEGDYSLYPGHDAPTTLDHERKYNPLMLLGQRMHW